MRFVFTVVLFFDLIRVIVAISHRDSVLCFISFSIRIHKIRAQTIFHSKKMETMETMEKLKKRENKRCKQIEWISKAVHDSRDNWKRFMM